ncbi:MAG: hypothetical protein V1644_01450, partial [Candidatus Micrarchaeota archaeon]
QASQFRAYASALEKPPEVIEVLVDNETTSSEIFSELLLTSKEAGETTSRTFTATSGKLVKLVVTKTDLPIVPEISSETATIYQAVFDCKSKGNGVDVYSGNYAALLFVTIPESLNQDKAVAEFVINSFKC